MRAQLKRTADRDITVTGAWWLYSLNAYRRLFPAACVATQATLAGLEDCGPLQVLATQASAEQLYECHGV